MRVDVSNLIDNIKNKGNPSLIASSISRFVIESLRNDTINLYEAFWLNMEVIRFERMSCLQPAWHSRYNIRLLIEILNQKLLSHLYNDTNSEILNNWGTEAYRNNEERRSHYILDKYCEYINAQDNHVLLQELLDIRTDYDGLDFDDGPYHCEGFPYNFCVFEECLLKKMNSEIFSKENIIGDDIENLMVEISLL